MRYAWVRNRRALVITDTDDRLMAAAALTGLNSSPNNGYKTPAATGMTTLLLRQAKPQFR